MRKLFLFAAGWLLVCCSFGQTINQKLQKVFQQFEKDTQLKHAISALYVIDAGTGQVVFDKNSQIGLAPASTQKIITSVTAFELLGKGYGYKTFFYADGTVSRDTLYGNFIIKASGDPTLGSPRFSVTKREVILGALIKMLKEKKIGFIKGDVIIDDSGFETNSTPDGWIWQDIGNYYGAGAGGFCWSENQYDLYLNPGEKEGDGTEIIRTNPKLEIYTLANELKTGKKGSGDNAFIYLAPYTFNGFIRGTIPAGEKNFKISGSIPFPAAQFNAELGAALQQNNLLVLGRYRTWLDFIVNKKQLTYSSQPFNFIISPSLDSINYWFLKKSINLYGEALIKTLAYEKNGFGATDSGVAIIKNFWKGKGLDPGELNINDGSGLSPMNRVTAHAQVEILKYAKTKNWFPSFYNALPDYNGMKMKSGTIRDVKGFCGYHTSKAGKEYIFSFLVNNYNGKPGELVQKMYKVLDVLK